MKLKNLFFDHCTRSLATAKCYVENPICTTTVFSENPRAYSYVILKSDLTGKLLDAHASPVFYDRHA